MHNGIGSDIIINQNKAENIDKLLAQRNLYSLAKCLQNIIFIITVPLPIIISLILNWYEDLIDEKNWVYVLYLILILFTEKVLDRYIERYKKLAASIQEELDLVVLHIKKNEILNNLVVDNEVIRRYAKESRKSPKKVQDVTDWYSKEIMSINSNIATLLCQRSNIYYDFSVRKNYNSFLKFLVILTSTILLAISLRNNFSLKTFIIEVILPIIPIINFSYKEISNNNTSIDNLENLKNSIEGIITNIKINDSIDNDKIRNLQDRIYFNRLSSPLIPDIFFKYIRPKMEDEMNYSIEVQIQKILNQSQS